MLNLAKKMSSGWTTVAFGDVVRLSKERSSDPEADGYERYIGLEHIDPGDLRVRCWGNVADGVTFTSVFRPGQVLFGKRRAYQRKVAVADFSGVCSGDIYVLEPKGDRLLPELLPFICQTDAFFEHAVGTSAGSLSPRTNWKSLADFEFALPPIEEQRRIVAALACAYSVIEAQHQLLGSLKVLRQAFIDSETKSKGSGLRLGDHCEMQNGRPFPGDEYCDDGVLLLRPGNLAVNGYIDWGEEKTKRIPHRYLSEAADFVLTRGDVVINLTAQSLEDGFMGRACLVNSDEPSLLNQRIGRFRNFSEHLRPEFLYRCLQSSLFKAHAVSMCEGSKIKHLFWDHLAQFQLPQLDPEQQDAVCARAMQIDQQIDGLEKRLEQARAVKFRLLQSLWGLAEGSCQ
ncbi:MAG: restriction endonuclease subunit S [Candidatus Thiodiazotropha endolucinida]|nr:restriction endonuclease subunit S [Candidatus Thiodiazotropha taylori]MCG8094931.1 restriction endonuclease subunit S [Candidatus Thiodiazotropha endolucinida]MCG8045969.1 restriction endonuclease subunit S [Candidatus Thiodiazotropha taylori]MCG8052880.1 restriction endonuclease subunit S [Candidatus Thiodiazotropha taylori]MCG8071213.1 restriction endonuclease subunit S [Candidatus Thiodiazotropha taylori]